jgi:hypothetical protein
VKVIGDKEQTLTLVLWVKVIGDKEQTLTMALQVKVIGVLHQCSASIHFMALGSRSSMAP